MDLDFSSASEVLFQLCENDSRNNKTDFKALWHLLRLGAYYSVIQKHDQAKEIFQKISLTKETYRWSISISKFARRYLLNGAHFSAIELMIFQNLLEKVLQNRNQEIAEKLLEIVENSAKQADGSFNDYSVETQKSYQQRSFLNRLTFGYIGTVTIEPDSTLDNRVSYLLLKGSILRFLRDNEGLECIQELMEMKDSIYKFQHALCLIELGKYMAKEDLSQSVKYWNEVHTLSFDFEDPIKQRLQSYINESGGEVEDQRLEEIPEEDNDE